MSPQLPHYRRGFQTAFLVDEIDVGIREFFHQLVCEWIFFPGHIHLEDFRSRYSKFSDSPNDFSLNEHISITVITVIDSEKIVQAAMGNDEILVIALAATLTNDKLRIAKVIGT